MEEKKKKKDNKKYIFLAIAAIIILVGIVLIVRGRQAGWFSKTEEIPAYSPMNYDQNKSQKKGQVAYEPVYDENGALISDWNTYINNDLYFTFQYPASWSPKRVKYTTLYEIYFENYEINFFVDRNRINNPPTKQDLMNAVIDPARYYEGFQQDFAYVDGIKSDRISYISPADGGRVILIYVPYGQDIVTIEYHHKKHSEAVFDYMVSSFRFTN